jgi:hypothetical protein
VNSSAAPALITGSTPQYGFVLRRPLDAGEELLLAQAAYPSRIEFPAAVRISFLDSNGQQWSRTPSRLALNRYASRRKPGRLRGRARSQAHVFYWKEMLGERTINGPAAT